MYFKQPSGYNNTNVQIRFAKNDTSNMSTSGWGLFGPIGASGYILDGNSHDHSSTTISEIRHCTANQWIGVMYSREAKNGVVEVPSGNSNFTAKLLYVDADDVFN